MDNIQRLCEEIKNCREVWFFRGKKGDEPVPFSGLLDDVADIFEREGFGITERFLADKSQHSDWKVRAQAAALTSVVQILSRYPEVNSRRAVGRIIFKTLRTLRPQRRDAR